MREIAIALLGAIAAGIFQTIVGIFDRRREKETTLVALASEVDALCILVRHQRYLEAVEEMIASARNLTWEGHSLIADIQADYFEVFGALAPKLGSLEPEHARDIIRFYALCKSAVDSMRPDGPIAESGSREERLSSLKDQAAILRALLVLGDQIVTYPKKPLLPMALSQP